jgi:hypothetical protein
VLRFHVGVARLDARFRHALGDEFRRDHIVQNLLLDRLHRCRRRRIDALALERVIAAASCVSKFASEISTPFTVATGVEDAVIAVSPFFFDPKTAKPAIAPTISTKTTIETTFSLFMIRLYIFNLVNYGMRDSR